MTREKVTYILIVLGVLDLFSFYKNYESGMRILLTSSWEVGDTGGLTDTLFLAIMILNILFLLSLLASGFLSIFRPHKGLHIYYFQFPFRLIFVTLTFGFILGLTKFNISSWEYKVTMWLVTGLELFRLFFSIWIKQKYFSQKEKAIL